MNRRKKLVSMAGLLGAVALILSAHSVYAAVHWSGAWSAEKPAGQENTCWGGWAGEKPGSSAINGNDSGQVLAWCADKVNQVWTCGTQSNYEFFVRARGRNELFNLTENTQGHTNGESVGSQAGGLRLDVHQCQKGWDVR